MKAEEHAKVWWRAADALDKVTQTMPENCGPVTEALRTFCRTMALCYKSVADEQKEMDG